jgi:hypothetical protein
VLHRYAIVRQQAFVAGETGNASKIKAIASAKTACYRVTPLAGEKKPFHRWINRRGRRLSRQRRRAPVADAALPDQPSATLACVD